MTTLRWIRGRNPYRLNNFAVLQIGPQLNRAVIAASRLNLVAKIRRGRPHVVAGNELTEADVQAAEARLLRDDGWAEEVLLVHPVAGGDGDGRRMPEVSRAVLAATEPTSSPIRLRLANLPALAPLLPSLCRADLPWPEWDELGIPPPAPISDLAGDVQFDL